MRRKTQTPRATDNGTDTLFDYLKDYKRLKLKDACKKFVDLETVDISIWVNQNGRWRHDTDAERRFQRLEFKNKSVCESIVTRLYGLSREEYEKIRNSFDQEMWKSWAGIYQAIDDNHESNFALVVELPAKEAKIGAGGAAGLAGTAGLIVGIAGTHLKNKLDSQAEDAHLKIAEGEKKKSEGGEKKKSEGGEIARLTGLFEEKQKELNDAHATIESQKTELEQTTQQYQIVLERKKLFEERNTASRRELQTCTEALTLEKENVKRLSAEMLIQKGALGTADGKYKKWKGKSEAFLQFLAQNPALQASYNQFKQNKANKTLRFDQAQTKGKV
jgi:hypothetical protein